MRNHLLLGMALLALPGCAGMQAKQLRADIDALNAEIAAREVAIESTTGDLGTTTDGVRAQAAYRPIILWGARLSERPADQRTVSFRSTSKSGYLFRDRKGCGWLPRGELYAELYSDQTKARVTVDRFTFQPVASGLEMVSPLSLHAEARVHIHIKPPCLPGGGAGTNIFVDADKTTTARLALRFGPAAADRLPYELVVIDPASLPVTLQFHLGWLGTVGFPIEMKDLARKVTDGSVDLLMQKEGVLGPLPNGQSYAYTLKTTNPNFGSDLVGLRVAAGLDVELTPQ
jgi:hypothetical protein